MPASDSNRAEYEKMLRYVLAEDASDEDERHVLVEENFAASLKLEWPDYVKAMQVKVDAEAGMKAEDIAAKYSWDRSKVRETIRILEIVEGILHLPRHNPDRPTKMEEG